MCAVGRSGNEPRLGQAVIRLSYANVNRGEQWYGETLGAGLSATASETRKSAMVTARMGHRGWQEVVTGGRVRMVLEMGIERWWAPWPRRSIRGMGPRV